MPSPDDNPVLDAEGLEIRWTGTVCAIVSRTGTMTAEAQELVDEIGPASLSLAYEARLGKGMTYLEEREARGEIETQAYAAGLSLFCDLLTHYESISLSPPVIWSTAEPAGPDEQLTFETS